MANKKASPIVVGDISVSQEPIVRAIPKTSPLPQTSNIQLKQGWLLLAKVDNDGNEILGTEVQVSQRTYDRTFSKNANYIVKKNPNQ